MKQQKVLFFTRKKCHKSQEALKFLRLNFEDVKVVWSSTMAESLPSGINDWKGDYIFSYRSYFVLPLSLINKAVKGAVNFHTGPPEYPGVGSFIHALYNNDKEFGVTTHFMNEKIDNGKIIRVDRFPIFDTDTLESLSTRTHFFLLRLFYDVTSKIIINDDFLEQARTASTEEKWSYHLRTATDVDNLYNIPINVDEKELLKRIRSTHYFGKSPYINLYGKKFILESDTVL